MDSHGLLLRRERGRKPALKVVEVQKKELQAALSAISPSENA